MAKARLRLAMAALLAATAPTMTGALGRTTNLDDRLLAAHNRERASLGIAPLVWDAKLATDATGWARHIAATGAFEHSADDPADPDPEGENLWGGTKNYYSPEAMIGLWVAEKQDFKPGVFPNNSRSGDYEKVGHYTQLMWRSTTAVGCALVPGRDDEFLVCRYSEGGNVIGERPF